MDILRDIINSIAGCRLITPPNIDIANYRISLLLLIVTILSVVCAFLVHKHSKRRGEKATACDLAKYYSDNIIGTFDYIIAVFSRTKIDNKVAELFPLDQVADFDCDELNKFIQRAECTQEELENVFYNINVNEIYLAQVLTNSFQIRPSVFMPQNQENTDLSLSTPSPVMQADFIRTINSCLNTLEWFAMNLHYRVADEALLYQSLHQSYISLVWQSYYYIASRNKSNDNKYYTNLIWLFNCWHSRSKEIIENCEKKKRRINRIANFFEDKFKQAKDLAEKTKPKIHSGKGL